ncbi:MAG: hypothetical protein WC796_05135 [Candidatus Pacearchaeota archaeon]|jgi:hypothetical protein
MKPLNLLTVILVAILVIIPIVSAVDCPRGIVNDSYPGICGLYTDSNNNEVCDLSEDTTTNIADTEINPINIAEKQNSILSTNYHFVLISLVTIIVYLLSYFLAKKQKLSVVLHRKIWNIILLVSFLITAVTSIVYLVNIDLGINFLSMSFISFWHIEIGLIMILISIFHALWHLPYFKSYVKLKKSE